MLKAAAEPSTAALSRITQTGRSIAFGLAAVYSPVIQIHAASTTDDHPESVGFNVCKSSALAAVYSASYAQTNSSSIVSSAYSDRA